MVPRALSSADLNKSSKSKAWREPRPLEGSLTRYISTRGEAPTLGFCDVMLTGLARDGGLYVPEVWPQLSHQTIAGFFGRPYWEVAVDVIRPFTGGEISDADLGRMANEAYATFRHPAVVPLDHRVGEPVDVVVNGRVVARGEVVVVEEDNSRFGVSLTEIVGPLGQGDT